VAGKSNEAVNQFTYLGSQINSKNVIKEEIRLTIQVGNRSLQTKNFRKTKISMLPVNCR